MMATRLMSMLLTFCLVAMGVASPAIPASYRQVLVPAMQGPLPEGSISTRAKRTPEDHIIDDGIFTITEEGSFFYKSPGGEAEVRAVMILAPQDYNIQLHFSYFDVPCDSDGLMGLVRFVDGWDWNNNYFPSREEHQKPESERNREICGSYKVKDVFESSQNVASILYLVPGRGNGFTLTVRFVRNPAPCNIMGGIYHGDFYTLRNYGRRINCTLTIMFPSVVQLLQLSVGVASAPRLSHPNMEIETGTIHKCEKRGMSDYVQILASTSLEPIAPIITQSVCGMDSTPGRPSFIYCGVVSVRLVSSGQYDNSVTVYMPITSETETSLPKDVDCGDIKSF